MKGLFPLVPNQAVLQATPSTPHPEPVPPVLAVPRVAVRQSASRGHGRIAITAVRKGVGSWIRHLPIKIAIVGLLLNGLRQARGRTNRVSFHQEITMFRHFTAFVALVLLSSPLFAQAETMLYVANSQSDTISAVSANGNVSTFATVLNNPQELAFDDSGNLYVAYAAGNGTISKITPGGSVTTFVTGLSYPEGLAIDALDNLYVSNASVGTITKVTPGGTISTFATGLDEPWGLAFDHSGDLFAVNWGGTINEITTGGTVSTFVTGLPYPTHCLAFDSSGNLYVNSYRGDTISEITPNKSISTFATGLNSPFGLAFDDSGNLYVSNQGDTISEVTPNGIVSTFATGLVGPAGIATAPTTEPSTLALSTSSVTLRAMRNRGTTTAVTLSETSGKSTAGFGSSLGGAATISSSSGILAAGGTQSLNLGWSSYVSTGPLTGTVTLSNTSNPADPFNSSGNVINMTGAVVDNRVVTAS